MLEKLFKLKEKGTTVWTEFVAGLSIFMAMSYIIFVNPSILSITGMDYGAVYVATIVASAIATLITGFYANVPYVQSAGLGLNALFTYTICGSLGFSWQEALAMVFISGVINVLITVTSIRKKVIKAMPVFMQEAITVGIGLFITYIGVKNAGLIEFSVSNLTDGMAKASDVVPQLAVFNNKAVILSLIGLFITSVLASKKNKCAYILGIIITTLIGIPMGVTQLPEFSSYTLIPTLQPTFFKLDFVSLFSSKSILVVIMTIFSLVISDLFDTIGTFIGTGKKAGIFEIDEKGNMPKNLERAMFTDSIATVIGSLLGTSNIGTFVESSVGIATGGRTGLTAVFAAIFFALSLFISPLVACVPMAAIAPVLILVGVSMIQNVVNINWEDMLVAIPAFFIIIMMPFSYSITTGIEFGFIFYAIISIANKRAKEVSPMIYIFTILFAIKFLYNVFTQFI